MLEGLVAWVLNNYLGKYVENLNTDQLSVALLSGKVELENLPLKKDALRHLGLPVEVKTGFIGKVQLHVPVRQIRSAPWLIAIEKLYVVAAPVNLDEWDSTVEANIAHERKTALLDALEAQWRAEHEASDGGYYATSYSSWLSYGTGLLANIVENLQLKINDVHIRYEDALTCAPDAFACGLTAESLTAESCDKEWVRGFTLLTETDGCSFKLLELHKLAVYWDPVNVPTGLYANYTLAELTNRMCQTWRNPHSYLLPPASALARVRRERTEQPLRSYTRPRIKCNLTLDKVALNLTSRQYNEVVGCSMGLERIGRLREFRARRPNVLVGQCPRDWWLYALKCHLPDHTWTDPKPTWESCLERSKKVRQYVDICLLILNNPTATLPPEQKAAKDEFEWRTPLHLLKPLREIAMRKVPASSPVTTPEKPSSSGRSALVHWFPQWWGWYGATTTPETPLNTTPDLEEEILDVIADSLENNTLLKRDTVFGHFEFTLNKGSLNLTMVSGECETDGGSLELAFERVVVRVESRPRAGSHALHVELGAVCLRDKITRDTLFPVLIAPQGMIRENLSAINPSAGAWNWGRSVTSPPPSPPPLFQLTYEHRPVSLNCDYKVWVRSQPLEVVYALEVVRWAQSWRTPPRAPPPVYSPQPPHSPHSPHSARQRLLNHWEHMMHADMSERRSWHVELDISAPQILLVEDLCNKDGAVLVLDLGRMRLTNAHDDVLPPAATSPNNIDDELTPPNEDDEERFMTPCSTPPGSLLSPGSPPDPPLITPAPPLDPSRLHRRLYDRYDMEFSDLQILVGRAKDNWKYAHTKSTSSLHLLDRFSISLQAERRVIHTSDPQYPTATLCGTLPALVVHLSEQKLAYVANIAQITQFTFGSNHQDRPAETNDELDDDDSECSETERTEHSVHNNSRLFILQFAIDQMSLEVQSRGRSIAEVQVCGVRAGVTQRPCDTSLSLSVHSLLLVDALQTYGADFELLVASHKHVGMDVQSGSILGSEPTSPASPSSPLGRSPPAPALQQAIHSLHQATIHRDTIDGGRVSPAGLWGAGAVDEEALIAIELCLVTGPDGDQLRIANILFNSLDIIANQETIVELIGFTQRVLGVNKKSKSNKPPAESTITEVTHSPSLLSMAGVGEEIKKEVRTEVTFDFQRLGVLLLRAAVSDGGVVAKKIATATLSEAKIRATIGRESWSVGGSLGGACVVGLVGAGRHSRVLSAGSPRPALLAPRALHFHLTRELATEEDQSVVSVSLNVHVASVWYTHSGPFLAELRSCVSEFKQYLANLARSIRNAAADMAIGLVQPRSDSLYANPKLSQSMEGVSPRKRTTSTAYSIDDPTDFKERLVLSVSVELETPVVVLSRSPHSSEVLVAHLGRMSLCNKRPRAQNEYRLRLRDISLVSLDTADKLKKYKLNDENMALIYDVAAGKPVLHNTALQLTINYIEAANDVPDARALLEIKGIMVGGLRVTASRDQYSQLLDTLQWLGTTRDSTQPHGTTTAQQPQTTQESEVDPGAVPTLRLDPAVRAQVLAVHPPHIRNSHNTGTTKSTAVKVNFQLPIFSIELRGDFGKGEKSLVDLSFREFNVNYEQIHPFETSVQVSLHSVTMEDLTQDPDSKHRMLLVSHTPQVPKAVFVSKSCPDFVSQYTELGFTQGMTKSAWGSLPGELHTDVPIVRSKVSVGAGECATPPCSPVPGLDETAAALCPDDDLVYLNIHIRDPRHPDLATKYHNVQRHTKVAFNCLQLVLSIDSWVAVLDFFGVAADEPVDEVDSQPAQTQPARPEPEPESAGVVVTETSVVSLGVVLVSRRGEVCRTRVSTLALHATHAPITRHRTVTVSVAAVSITDLSPHARTHRERFSTDTLNVHYHRLSPAEALASGHDGTLKIELGPVTYVHTKRFIQQLQTYVRDFSRLRTVIQQARQKVSVSRLSRVLLSARCASLSLVVPVSGRARAALFADLAHVNIDNRFTNAGDEGVLPGCGESVEVRRVVIESVRVRAGAGRRREYTLLSAPAHLSLTLTTNLHHTHTIPDLTIEGTLTTLVCTLDPNQYKLIRGVLAHNLGENCEDLNQDIQHFTPEPVDNQGQVWTTLSIKLALHDVTVKLEPERGVTSLASINFIKSRLLVETYSDLSQDIDLVSQEILVSDTRYSSEPANRRGNVFTHIVQPLPEHRHSVQAEVHARKRVDSSAYTILVNNMRLMAILDWWEAANQFIMQPPMPAADPDHVYYDEISPCGVHQKSQLTDVEVREGEPFELKLNITESQLVLVEDAALWDTNSVILKSTAVITYRTDSSPDNDKPLSCVLNELEVFSCVLGLEEDTALAILDPAALHIDLTRDGTVTFSTSTLNLRLSYHDMRMFASMLKSLPAQARTALSDSKKEGGELSLDMPANMRRARVGPGVGGWPRVPPRPVHQSNPARSNITCVQVRADCITLCVIDDCLDSDVPLLEVSLSEMNLEQDLRRVEEAFADPVLVSTPGVAPPPRSRLRPGPAGGRLHGLLTADYYNRTLSGWEPVIEPWRFETSWEYTLTSNLSLARLQIEVSSNEILDLNVTSTLIELIQLVRGNWTADYYTPQCTSSSECSPKGSPAGYRRRSPFVPYALRNYTGQPLWFTTLTTTSDIVASSPPVVGPDDSWFVVLGGETEAFSFGGGRPRPRRASPPSPATVARLHQVALRLDHYSPPTPLCVDRVGTYFRNITHTKTGAISRLVFEVSLEGSARKLVTVRSALQVVNKLPHPVEIRVDNAPSTAWWRGLGASVFTWSLHPLRRTTLAPLPPIAVCPAYTALTPAHAKYIGGAVGGRVWIAAAGSTWAAPLWAGRAPLSVRPVTGAPLASCPTPLDWRRVNDQPLLQHLDCRAPPDHIYRFCCVIVRERFPVESGGPVAGHTLTLVPALRLENLLPVELHFRVMPPDDASIPSAVGTLAPGDTRPFHEVNVEEGGELSVKLEGFAWSSPLSIGGCAGGSAGNSFTARLKLRDLRGRRLYLTAKVAVKPTDGIKVCIYAGYWLVNRTGAPLVFRAGEGGEAAGQFEEHELARMVAPLVFSFADHDTGPTVAVRLGKGVGPQPEWCSPFGLGVGVCVKRLCVRESEAESVRAVGVCIRGGRGRYRHTNIVTVAPRYQLHNNTTRKLLFAQKCTATTIKDPVSSHSHVSAVEGCWVPWNWARWDRDHVLCVRSAGPAPSHWSGPFSIDTPRTLHISCREESGGGYWLVRVEVVLQSATLFVVLTDGDRHPPPVRIDNYSPVSVMFHQVGCVEEQVVGGHGRVVWAPGEPEGAGGVSLRAPGGPRATLRLDVSTTPPQPATLLYQNFIYVAFTHTCNDKNNSAGNNDNVLVLEVPIGTTRVVLGRKRYGERSQLWRRGPNEQLIHEGSSPPQPTDALHSDETFLSAHTMVLDIEGPGPQPGRVSALVLRRSDPRRVSTQTWRTHNGYMCCAHNNLAVQPDGGLLALTPGGRVVLGLQVGVGGPPPEQAVEWQTLRPGSGRLELTVYADGPTKVIKITDAKAPEACWLEEGEVRESNTARWGEWGVRAVLGGAGVSLVSRSPPAELLYARLHGLTLDLALSHSSAALALTVQSLHADNQLLGTSSPVLVHEVAARESPPAPALHLSLDLARPNTSKYNALYFKHFVVSLRPIAVRLEEKLILRIALFVSLPDEENTTEQPDEADYETQRTLHELTATTTTRYYFSVIKFIPTLIRLSMCTANKLEPELSAVKRRLGLTLIKFEDAAVELEPFMRTHIYETPHYLATIMLKHFKDELKWQAAKILGSVDFLGNPLGFVADVSEGVSGLIYEGNVGALLKNVTHGISNSAAKVTESLGDGLERVVVDEAHEETRRRIRTSGGGHLAAGFRGLGLGILGGMTSLVKHSYEGATSEGLPGFLAGVGKGLVGTVTKPVIGVLDLAAETASALRDTSRRSDKSMVSRVRAPRCAVGAGGLLPRYCPEQARGAALLHVLNSHDHSDMFLAYCVVRGPPHDIRALVSAHYLRIFTCKNDQPQIVMETHLSNLVSCAVVHSGGAELVELGVRGGEVGAAGREAVRRPRVQCDSPDIAAALARHLAYATQLYHDLTHTLHPHTYL